MVDFFVLRKKEIREYNGQSFLKLELGDKTGRIDGVVWENPQRIYGQAETGDIVKVKGLVTTYRDASQLKVERLRKAEDQEVDLSDFLPASEIDTDSLLREFKEVVSSIQNTHLISLTF